MPIVHCKSKLKHGQVTVKGVKYDLMFGHPKFMLQDVNLSWDTKGRLSHYCFVDRDSPIIPKKTFDELVKFGYLVEVKNGET